MLKSLTLKNFKNFKDAHLEMGPLTVLVGTNASGKSNLRDAFRFLHGVSRGYTLAEIIGEKWIESGVLQWHGIRGGTREVATWGTDEFSLEVLLSDSDARYRIVVKVDDGRPPRVIRESLHFSEHLLFEAHDDEKQPGTEEGAAYLQVRLGKDSGAKKGGKRLRCISTQPALSQLMQNEDVSGQVKSGISTVLSVLSSMRFLDLAPDAMRLPSLPGHPVLSDRGENLSSVLYSTVANKKSKQAVLGWIRELTPQDVVDFRFDSDQSGRILLSLVESGGQVISANSISDGTLRFLAMIAAFLSPVPPASFYFFEEIENGIHPTRIFLLLQLIEQQTAKGKIQVVATTHSPQVLGLLGEKARDHAALVYRLEDRSDAQIKRIVGIGDAARVLSRHDLGELHASGWLENALEFQENRADSDAGAKRWR